MNEYVGALRS